MGLGGPETEIVYTPVKEPAKPERERPEPLPEREPVPVREKEPVGA